MLLRLRSPGRPTFWCPRHDLEFCSGLVSVKLRWELSSCSSGLPEYAGNSIRIVGLLSRPDKLEYDYVVYCLVLDTGTLHASEKPFPVPTGLWARGAAYRL